MKLLRYLFIIVSVREGGWPMLQPQQQLRKRARNIRKHLVVHELKQNIMSTPCGKAFLYFYNLVYLVGIHLDLLLYEGVDYLLVQS